MDAAAIDYHNHRTLSVCASSKSRRAPPLAGDPRENVIYSNARPSARLSSHWSYSPLQSRLHPALLQVHPLQVDGHLVQPLLCGAR